MKEYEEITLDNIDQIVEMDAPESEIWYRGQTNKNWQLIPSFFRNARKTFLWEWNDIHSEYSSKPKKVSLIKKLQEFGIHKDLSPYRIASFIQHSIGYSPLIDLTKSPAVALSFALSNTSAMVNFHNDNACVYALNLKGSKILTDLDEIDKALESAKTQTFKPNELIINIVTNKMWQDMLIGAA